MEDHYYQALFPGSWRICGRRLRPFCAYHRVILEAIGSPFADPAAGSVSSRDLVLALRVCGLRWDPAGADLRPRVRDAWLCWRFDRRRKRFERALRLFAGYLAAHNSYPQYWADDAKKGGGVTAPGMLSLVASAIHDGMAEREAWEMSLGRLHWLDGAISERFGAGSAKFKWQAEGDEVDSLPDLSGASDAELREIAIREMGRDAGIRWWEMTRRARRANQNGGG